MPNITTHRADGIGRWSASDIDYFLEIGMLPDGDFTGSSMVAVIEDNTSRWSGNHLMSPDVVPGILLVNRKLEGNGYDLTDVTATLFAHYGIEPLTGMIGEVIR